jgi:ATP-dependent DNA helicase RecG
MARISPAVASVGVVEVDSILSIEESHFFDLKGIAITPAKLTRTVSAFANAEGGEIYVGVDEDLSLNLRSWKGFQRIEDANAFIQTLEAMAPLGDDISCTFIRSDFREGLVLKIDVKKTADIKSASDGQIYVRRSAQNLPVRTDEALTNLKRAKGLVSFEDETVATEIEEISDSKVTRDFIQQVVPQSAPSEWLIKQRVIIGNRPTVAGIILFSDEPQALLPKRSGIKIYRYKTNDAEGTRDTLAADPLTIEGHTYNLIKVAVQKTVTLIESVQVNTERGLERLKYPPRALHEIITNAVLHRDYSIADDIHIRVFDNRVEVHSPGALPAHITPQNIRQERFSRNAKLVRLINKFPDPPNKDIGEGLNTAFDEMRKMKLREPFIAQDGGYVRVELRHEPLASPEELILEFLNSHEQITNKEARGICFIGSENKMKGILQKMVKNGIIELVPGRTRYNAAYKKLVIDRAAPKQSELF